jgi:3-amino-5-hydroxybenzoate synthase
MALGIGRGDEVIVPAFTFISTASAVLSVNAVPVLVDIRPDTYCIDPDALAAAITPRTRAIIPVHMAGEVADMDAIVEIARRHSLAVIEDAAHAHGAEWKGRRAGALHTAGIFSFQAFKLMSAGEGGLILSNDTAFIERCFLYGNCGRPKTDRTYQHSLLGSNYRMSELHAAVLRVQLTRLDEQIARREANARLLDHLLGEVPGIVPQRRSPNVTRNPHYMYMFRYDSAEFGGLDRQQFVSMLNAEGIPAFVSYLPIHRTPVFRSRTFGPRWSADDPLLPDYARVECPVAEDVGTCGIWLHHRALLGDEQDVGEIVDAIRKIAAHTGHSIGVA